MSSRDRSATAPLSPLAPSTTQPKKPRKREYLATYKKTEQQLTALQRDVQEEQQKHQELNEKNLILAGLIHVQERIKAIYEKHQRWLAAGGPTEEELKLQQQLKVDLQVGGCHWNLYALETATWEQLQAALSYDCSQWMAYLNKYFQKLAFFTEILKRSPEQQAQLLKASGISPAPHLPLVYNFKGLNDTLTPAWAAVLETLQTNGCLATLALLHSNFSLLDAASRHAGTGQRCVPLPTYWARLAQRMRFSRLQKLHFKLALENHARQTRAAAVQGLAGLKETPSYAFLLACEAIAAQQEGPERSFDPAAAAAPGPAAAAATAGWQANGVANGHPMPDFSSKSSQSHQRQSPDTSASGDAAAMPAPLPPPPRTTAAAAAAGNGLAAAAAAGIGAAGTEGCLAEAVAAVAAAAAAALTGGVADVDMASGAELQRQIGIYVRQTAALSMFLVDTMSPKQGLIMNRGSYPFWPVPASICEAALQLPDDDSQAATAPWQDPDEVVPDSIELLLSHRRNTMAEAHDSLIPVLMKLRL